MGRGHRVLTVLAAGVAVLLLASGCGSKSKSSQSSQSSPPPATTTTPTALGWAEHLCTAVDRYTATLRKLAATVQANPSKANLRTAVGKAKSATDAFAATIQNLRAPNAQAGRSVKRTIQRLQVDLRKDAAAIERATSGSTPQPATLAVVGATLVKVQSQLTNALAAFKGANANGGVREAFGRATACKSLASS